MTSRVVIWHRILCEENTEFPALFIVKHLVFGLESSLLKTFSIILWFQLPRASSLMDILDWVTQQLFPELSYMNKRKLEKAETTSARLSCSDALDMI